MGSVILVAGCLAAAPGEAERWRVLPEPLDGGPANLMLGRYLRHAAEVALERRRERLEKLESEEQIRAYQQRLRGLFLERIGGLPPRTPLGVQLVGTLEGDGYRVEKLLYESQPQHYVTATLYLPKAEPPYPAVLIPSGHSRTAKAADYNQHAAIGLAQHGIAALCYDPIGQGERSQLLDAGGQPRFNSTTEHTLLGASCILLGRNTATYRIWDGMRSLDLLAARPDVDSSRLGVTGCSGGGTLTSYLMALDDRVRCAAPSCYVTSFARLLDTIGPQDAEQNIAGQLGWGMDHADYAIVRAPKPTLLLTATHDFFDIQGSWNAFREAKQLYTKLGFPERVGLVETDSKHGFPRSQREAMVHWMRRWLDNVDERATERETTLWTERQLACTPNGQTLRLEGAVSVMELNRQLLDRVAAPRRKRWAQAEREQTLKQVRALARIRPVEELPPVRVRDAGRVEAEGYVVQKLVLEPEEGIWLPALHFLPKQAGERRVLLLHDEGKHVEAGPKGRIATLVREGATVLAIDLRGVGETGESSRWGGNWKDIFTAYLLDQPLLGMRAEDVLTATRFLAQADADGQPRPVEVIARGVCAIPALHAVALEPQWFAALTREESIHSWAEVIGDPTLPGQLANAVHGALLTYDLPDLARAAADAGVQVR